MSASLPCYLICNSLNQTLPSSICSMFLHSVLLRNLQAKSSLYCSLICMYDMPNQVAILAPGRGQLFYNIQHWTSSQNDCFHLDGKKLRMPINITNELEEKWKLLVYSLEFESIPFLYLLLQ